MKDLKAQLAKLLESSEDEEASAPETKPQNIRKTVHFRSAEPGPQDLREALDARRSTLEHQASNSISVSMARGYPHYSFPQVMSGNPSIQSAVLQHGQDGGACGAEFADNESIASTTEEHIAGERFSKSVRKSGITMRASDRVYEPQLWPHVALKGEFMAQNLSFHDLDLQAFIAGELEIITSPFVTSEEHQGRLHLLKELVSLSRGYDWDILRNVYASIVSKIEIRTLSWAQWSTDFTHQIQFALVRQQMVKGQSQGRRKTTARSAKIVESEGTFFCKEFNQGSCSKGDLHSSTHKGKRVTVSHICAKCWLSDRVRRAHPERDTACPHSKQDTPS